MLIRHLEWKKRPHGNRLLATDGRIAVDVTDLSFRLLPIQGMGGTALLVEVKDQYQPPTRPA